MAVVASLVGFSAVPGSSRTCQAQSTATWDAPAWVLPADQVKKYLSTDYLKDKTTFRLTNPSSDQARQGKRVVQSYLSQLTYEDKAAIPRNVSDKLLADLQQQSASLSPAMRQILMDEVVALAPDILTHPEDLVRYNMIAILVQLSVKPRQVANGVETPAVPFNGAHKVFMTVILNKNEFLGCRILAARGLDRICRDGENAPSSNEKSDIAVALTTALSETPPATDEGTSWFRLRLIEALGVVDRIDNSSTQPIVIEALMNVIVNQNERWFNRAAACQSITQLPYNGSVNIPLVTSEIVKFLHELGTEFNKSPASPELKDSFQRVYLAFRPATSKLAKDKKWGLLFQVERPGLSTHASVVNTAWDVVFPVVQQFMEAATPGEKLAPIPSDKLTALTNWLTANTVTTRDLTPGGAKY
ncbi:hypothetical protein SH668x_001939 [Planctomicrobium sp. SH668]|uniref:hypothetical protein n=1 Tax=Planctomicrobium sp. SH668 TaxID=3448126 RepID=UPI003F5B7D41